MASRKESERTKFIQEKCLGLLTQMLRDEDNKYCVDCDAKGPRWASWNLGVFLCIRCAGIHRNLGVHISRVRSVNLDTWTPEQVVSLQQMGNSRARAVYEAQLPDGFRRPQTDTALESFIRAKYEHKKYMAREWVPVAPTKANWDKEVDEEMEKLKRKKKTSSSLGISTAVTDKKSVITVKSPIPAPLPKPKASSNSPKSSIRLPVDNNSASSDLLGLTSPTTNGPTLPSNSATIDLSTDAFSNFLSAPPSNVVPVVAPATNNSNNDLTSTTLAKEEQDFFNQAPNDAEKARMTKDSILALYGTAPTSTPSIGGQFNGGFNQFAAPATGFPGSIPSMQHGFGGQQFGQNHNFINASATPSSGLFGNQLNSGGFPPQIQQQGFASFPAQAFGTQPFAQSASQPSNANNINQQFGNLNLGNVWQ